MPGFSTGQRFQKQMSREGVKNVEFKKVCEQVGYDPHGFNPPEKVYKYFAYKGGQSYECGTKSEAEKISPNTEKVLVNGDEVEAYVLERLALERKAVKLWQTTLRSEYSDIPDEIYAMCHERAYDANHSYGYDSVAERLESEIEFARKILDWARNSAARSITKQKKMCELGKMEGQNDN